MCRFLLPPVPCLVLRALAAIFLAAPLPTLHAAVTWTGTGNVEPSDPSTWTDKTYAHVGAESDGNLYVYSGAIISKDANIGDNQGVKGFVMIDGTASTWTTSSLDVGVVGSGELLIRHGGTVTSTVRSSIAYNLSPSTSKVTVADAGSTWTNSWLAVGHGGTGTLSVSNGGAVTSSNAFIGNGSSSKGTATVSGSGSRWDNTSLLYVGMAGNGTLSVSNGGTVTGSSIYVGHDAHSQGTVTVSGSGSTWTASALKVGFSGSGAVKVQSDGNLVTDSCQLGYNHGATGVITVSGTNSNWTNAGDLSVCGAGSGTVNITTGGRVTVTGTTYVAGLYSSDGSIDFGTNGGTLTTTSLVAASDKLAGTGTINTNALVSNIDLVFDSTASLKRAISINGLSGQNIVVNLDMSNDLSANGVLGAGAGGTGSMTVINGVGVKSTLGYIGYGRDATGVVNVAGPGSAWTNSSYLYIGYGGSGTLNITGGGRVSDSTGYLGSYNGNGAVVVSDSGSTWTNTGNLCLGIYDGGGHTSLSIKDGGLVTAAAVNLRTLSLLDMDIGRGSTLIVGGGSGTITNDSDGGGTIRFTAAACIAAGEYMPIYAGTWNGEARCEAIGGTWNTTTHRFIVSAAQMGTSGTAATIDLTSTQRVLIRLPTSGRSVGISLAATDSPTPIALIATVLDGAPLESLNALLMSADESFLSGWEFTLTGSAISASNPAYLSFEIGAGHSLDDLSLWHYDGSEWTEYAANDLNYDGQYASFTVTSFSGYAVSAVPEPCAAALLLVGLLSLAGYARRRSGCA